MRRPSRRLPRGCKGHGPLQHSAETRAAVFRTAHQLVQAGLQPDLASVYQLFRALDRLTASALRIVVHMTYARRIRVKRRTKT